MNFRSDKHPDRPFFIRNVIFYEELTDRIVLH